MMLAVQKIHLKLLMLSHGIELLPSRHPAGVTWVRAPEAVVARGLTITMNSLMIMVGWNPGVILSP